MSDTSAMHAHDPAVKTEPDAVNFRGLVWFGVILVVTVLICMGIVTGMFSWFGRQASEEDAANPSLAEPFGQVSEDCVAPPLTGGEGRKPCITKTGQVEPGRVKPQPNLMADDPLGLKTFREEEDQKLTTYGVMDKNAGTYRIPIDRAKDLILQRGIPGGTAMSTNTAPPQPRTEPDLKAQPTSSKKKGGL